MWGEAEFVVKVVMLTRTVSFYNINLNFFELWRLQVVMLTRTVSFYN